jgi:restriction endonuclease S subunit
MDLLALNGTAVGVIKEGLFFDSSYMELRNVLLKNYNVKEIISVPQNQFENTSTKTSIIIFNNDGDIKTTEIKFSELKVNIYEKDEFIEIIQNDKIEIKLKYNKGDIINIEEVFIKSVSINDILKNDIISLNSKDYNKVSIIPGEDFELVKLGDICEYLPTTKHYTNIGKENGKYKFYNSSQENKLYVDFCEVKDYSIILGQGGNFNIHIDKNFTASKHVCVLQLIKTNDILLRYIYYIIPLLKQLLITNGSTISWLNKTSISNMLISIPKTPELINKWVNLISEPFDMKQQKELRFKELEEEIKNKIKDIQENHECEEMKLGDICIINSGKFLQKNNIVKGKFDIIGGGKIIGKHNISNREGNDIVLTRVGAININYILEPYYLTDNGLAIKSQKYNNMLIYYYMIINLDYIYKLYNGSNQKVIKKTELENFKIKLPKDKSLIDNLEPIFDEIEELHKEIKELDETYNNQLKELGKEAIKNQEILNTNEIIEEELTEDIKEEIEEETPSIKSTKSQTIEELKEQCKSLGIKGYSKKKKDELIELIKNHK